LDAIERIEPAVAAMASSTIDAGLPPDSSAQTASPVITAASASRSSNAVEQGTSGARPHEIFGLSDNIRRRGAPHRPEQGRRGRTSGRSSTPWRRRSRLRECRESRWKTPSGTSGDEPAGHEEPRQLFVNFLATCRRLRELGQRKKAL
jgi:hypothetical protein